MQEPIAVIIPYFPRRPGMLGRTLAAVLGQDGGIRPLVVIVDDGSPVVAEGELQALDAACRRRVEVARQPNDGPAKARKTGLDTVGGYCEIVALSDSDDVWPAWHRADGIAAFDRGHALKALRFQQGSDVATISIS